MLKAEGLVRGVQGWGTIVVPESEARSAPRDRLSLPQDRVRAVLRGTAGEHDAEKQPQ
jgi:hypothetical protein